MKYQLPTSHWIYFCAQVKKDKIDSNNASGQKNVSNVLSQARMALDHPIFDPELNRKVLLDHLFLISASEITKAARTWLIEQLDSSQRRHIIFMDSEDFLCQVFRILIDLRLEPSSPKGRSISTTCPSRRCSIFKTLFRFPYRLIALSQFKRKNVHILLNSKGVRLIEVVPFETKSKAALRRLPRSARRLVGHLFQPQSLGNRRRHRMVRFAGSRLHSLGYRLEHLFKTGHT